MKLAVLDVNEAVWGIDQGSYFLHGFGFWARIANASIDIPVQVDNPGIMDYFMRVRTGQATATDLLFSYVVTLNGTVIPMALDTTRPPEKRTEFGGSYVGWIKGSITIPDRSLHKLNFKSIKPFGAFDGWEVTEKVITQADLDAAVLQAKTNAYTKEQLEAKYNEGIAAGEARKLASVKSIVAGW